MVVRIPLAGILAILVTSAGRGQTPAPASTANAISAEATETLRASPDVARITFQVVYKNPVAETATDENEKLTKDLLTSLAKLKIAGAKVTAQSLKLGKLDGEAQPGVPNAVPMSKSDFRAVRSVTVTVKDADAEQLPIHVARIQKEAAKLGVAGESANNLYNPFCEKHNSVKVSYGLQDGWDDRSKTVLGKLTKRALERATLLAEGAGLKVVEVLTVEEPRDPPAPERASIGALYGLTDTSDDLADGELVLKVRVRVTVRVSK